MNMDTEPRISRFPTEIFGYPYVDNDSAARQALENQSCRFLNHDICRKPRKSEPHIKVGVCSVGYKGRFLDSFQPVVICPHRFRESVIFETIQQLYLNAWNGNIIWVSEVSIGTSGSVDYVAAKLNETGDEVEDFLCVEFQAAGTTGTPWQAVLEFKNNRVFQSDSYKYGINWANEFSKTMMQQVYKKGRVVKNWNKKIVFVIQDVAMSYLEYSVDTSGLRPAQDEDPVHFVTFTMEWMTGIGWEFRFKESVSTDLDGINRILMGANPEDLPSEGTFKNNIYSKGRSDGTF